MPLSEEERWERVQELQVLVDHEDAWLLTAYTWDMWGTGSIGTTVWDKATKTQHHALLHHCIIGQPIDGTEVDHIDRNFRNNHRNNLRYVTARDNVMNTDRIDNSYLIRETEHGTYQVRVFIDGIRHNKNADTIVEAERIRDTWLALRSKQEI
jgi:hypothetical protein